MLTNVIQSGKKRVGSPSSVSAMIRKSCPMHGGLSANRERTAQPAGMVFEPGMPTAASVGSSCMRAGSKAIRKRTVKSM